MEHRIRDQEKYFRWSNVLLEKLMLEETIADVAIQEDYEQRLLDLKYIFYKTILVQR
jgi:hypothetical protein